MPPCDHREMDLRHSIVDIGRRMYDKGWVAANDGNISVRLGGGRLLVTPTCISKGMMSPEDLIVVDMAGKKMEGRRECTTEICLHLTIYEMRPDVNAVVHAHPPVATGFATAGKALDRALLPEVVVTLGCVPLAEYGLPGTAEVTKPMRPLIPYHDAILMGNHGAVTYGHDLQTAFFRMDTVEHSARIALVAELLGGARVLPRREVDRLIDARSRYGVHTRAGAPMAAEDVEGLERMWVSREELVTLVDQALRARGAAS